MYSFSQRSDDRLETCHQDLQDIMHEVIKIMDITILCGHRPEDKQTKAFNEGKSKLQFPNSKHNQAPSLAVDIAPWVDGAIPWNDREKFFELAGIVKGIAYMKGIKIKWGGDFNSFFDGPHFEKI